MKALRVRVESWETGRRAGDLDPLDRSLPTLPAWQDIAGEFEVRLVLDERRIARFEGIDGIEVLDGEAAIDAAIAEIASRDPDPRATIVDRDLVFRSAEAQGIDLLGIVGPERSLDDAADDLLGAGIHGIRRGKRRTRPGAAEGAKRLGALSGRRRAIPGVPGERALGTSKPAGRLLADARDPGGPESEAPS